MKCKRMNLPVVNFINVIRKRFSYKCCCVCNFFLFTCTQKKLPKRHSYEKFVCRMLMKLTPVIQPLRMSQLRRKVLIINGIYVIYCKIELFLATMGLGAIHIICHIYRYFSYFLPPCVAFYIQIQRRFLHLDCKMNTGVKNLLLEPNVALNMTDHFQSNKIQV